MSYFWFSWIQDQFHLGFIRNKTCIPWWEEFLSFRSPNSTKWLCETFSWNAELSLVRIRRAPRVLYPEASSAPSGVITDPSRPVLDYLWPRHWMVQYWTSDGAVLTFGWWSTGLWIGQFCPGNGAGRVGNSFEKNKTIRWLCRQNWSFSEVLIVHLMKGKHLDTLRKLVVTRKDFWSLTNRFSFIYYFDNLFQNVTFIDFF